MTHKNSTVLRIKEHTSFVNAIRRAVLNCSPCYAPADELSEDNIKILRDVFGVPEVREKFLVLKLNCGNLLKMNQRVQRLPFLSYSEDGDKIDYSRLYFSFCGERPQDPFENRRDTVQNVYFKDIKVFHVSEDNRYTQVESLGNYIDLENGYGDFVVAKLNKDQMFHCFFQVVEGVGYNNSKWQPCTFRYRIIPKSETVDGSLIMKPDYILNTQREVERDPEIELTIEYNGKVPTEFAFLNAISSIQSQFRYFIETYGGINQFTRPIMREDTDIEGYEVLTLFMYSDSTTGGSSSLANIGLGDHGFGNLFACSLLKYLLDVEKIDVEDIRDTLVSYRQPHPLDQKIHLHLKLPDRLLEDDGRLRIYRTVVDSISTRLEACKALAIFEDGRPIQVREERSEGKEGEEQEEQE
jgi:DNA-directed RNA polymerase subunit L